MLTRCSGTPGHPDLLPSPLFVSLRFSLSLSFSGRLTERGPLRGDEAVGGWVILSVGEATAHCRPCPPPTATAQLCRRSMLVPLGRPRKRDSVIFRWNALGAQDSAEDEQRLREVERERNRRRGRRHKDSKLYTGYILEN